MTTVESKLRLQPGRVRTTFSALRETWAFNDQRIRLLDELIEFTGLIREILPICSVWVGGSWLSDDEIPRDIDAVLLIDSEAINRLTDIGERRLVTTEGLHEFANAMELNVDVSVQTWKALPSVAELSDSDWQILQDRGFWDDWWQRVRSVPRGARSTRLCSLPRRGYAEVVIDGFK